MKLHFVKIEHYRQKAQWLNCTVRKAFLYILLFYVNGRNIIYLLFHKFHNAFSLQNFYLPDMLACKVSTSRLMPLHTDTVVCPDEKFLHFRKQSSQPFFYLPKCLLADAETFLFYCLFQCCRVLNFCNSKPHKIPLPLLVCHSRELNKFYFLFLVFLMPYYTIFVLQS